MRLSRTSPSNSGQLLVLDLARLDFCDSSGITALIAARNIATIRAPTSPWPRARPTRRGF
ncbi:hypothetical protein [Streptomyces sp. NPDC088348]|uniref:hypothetical protein n=1 Tax=Streptomyces sp. NPDC088348 TaxID=3365853 RepID=UPI0037FECAEE